MPTCHYIAMEGYGSNGDKIIARRLGHSNALTTIKYYMVITPEIEREALKGILL